PLFDGQRLPVVLSILAAAGLVVGFFRARSSVWMAMAIFFPFALFAWLMLDYKSIHRYSTAYAFLYAILAVHAIPPRRFAQLAAAGALAAACAWWTLPAVRDVRSSASPPVAALSWARDHIAPGRTIWLDETLRPWGEYFFGNRTIGAVPDRTKLPAGQPGDLVVTEELEAGATATFRRLRGRAWNVARRRYFETSVVPLPSLWVFGDGWHAHESDGELVWRWMGRRGEALLPPLPGRARLAMTLAAAGGTAPDVEVRLNDAPLARLRLTPQLREYAWVVDARGDAPNRLVIVSSATVKPSGDARELSVQVTALSWQPIR
ncbi:MAG TPA: hypothetical protein VKB93_25060, partial [Thermoanaerobaculia bacterium]|nr:hypothetical protein [Thermoanaerobaculia bacterium]